MNIITIFHANYLGYYNDTIFHRVIRDFVSYFIISLQPYLSI